MGLPLSMDLLFCLRRVVFSSVAFAFVLVPVLCKPQATSHADSHAVSKFSSPSQSDDALDMQIFVRPLSSEAANIGVAYSRQIAHSTVRADIERLMAAEHWQLASPIKFSDESVHPDRPKEFPPTTGAFIKVTHAPQAAANAPNLLPYLKAFQRLNRFDLCFEMPALQPYGGVTKVENGVTDIQMLHDEGLYTFQITIHNHKENIPALVNSGEAIDRVAASHSEADLSDAGQADVRTAQIGGKLNVRPPNYVLIAALALGAGTLVGGSLYLVMSRQASR